MIYLVDSAGARITDQVDMFPGRRGAGKIFHTQVRASGAIPQVCALFGPSAAGGAVHSRVLRLRGHGGRQRVDVPGQPADGRDGGREKTTLEEMGGARMHCTVSGCGHYLAPTEHDALAAVRQYLSYLPPIGSSGRRPARAGSRSPPTWRAHPAERAAGFDMRRFVRGLVDEGSFFEIHALWARELTIGFARLDGQVTGVVANNPMFKGGVLFVDSADKATRFIQLCDAFNVPLLFLADVPGFMVGTAVERQGIIRHGAKMISAVAEATVPKICVVVRKAYGAGLYAMAGPASSRTPRRPADGEDRGHGRRGGRQRRLLQQAGCDRRPGRPGAARPSGCAPSTRRTSTCSAGRELSSDDVVDRESCGRSWSAGSPPPRQGPRLLAAPPRRHPRVIRSRLAGASDDQTPAYSA